MVAILESLSTHSHRLDRWIGPEAAEKISDGMKDWYGPPIAVAGVPGNVWAMKGGDFRGRIGAGQFASALDFGVSRAKRIASGFSKRQSTTMNAGFSSLSDMIAEATSGKRREIVMQKAGSTGVVAVTSSLWRQGNQPSGGATPAAAAAGTAFTGASAGAQYGLHNVSADTRHLAAAWAMASVAGQTLLLYDLLYGVAKTMNSVANEAVTGVPTRYQSSTATDADYAGGNFLFIQVGGTQLAATAHNWGVAGGANECLYRNQAGTDNQVMPVLTGNSAAIVDRLDHPVGQWFAPLAAGDTGIMDLAQMRCSASVATGVIWFMIGHPLAFVPVPLANIACQYDGINTAFNLVRVFDDAALAWLELCKPATTATNYNAGATFIHG